MFVVRFYKNLLRALSRKPRGPSELYWWLFAKMMGLWNKPTWIPHSPASKTLAGEPANRILRFLARSRLTVTLGVLFWPAFALLLVFPFRGKRLRLWRQACIRPDLTLEFQGRAFSDQEFVDVRPDFFSAIFEVYDFNKSGSNFFTIHDKSAFYRICTEAGLPTPTCYSLDEALEQGGPWIVKDPHVDTGKGVFLVSDPRELRRLAEEPRNIIQKKLVNGRELQRVVGAEAPLSTFRIITNRIGARHEVVCTWLRMGSQGSHLDNLSAGGLASRVDPVSCQLHAAFDYAQSVHGAESPALLYHPNTKVELWSVRLSCAREAEKLALRAHRAIASEAYTVGWDVAASEGGLTLIEANFYSGSMEYAEGTGAFLNTMEAMFMRFMELERCPAEGVTDAIPTA